MKKLMQGRRKLRDLLLGAVALALLGGTILYQNNRFQDLGFRVFIYQQRIQLPPTEVLRFVALGYDNVYADWLWLLSIQAFGSGWRTEDGTEKPIFRFFDTLTDVDPKFISAYRFGNLVIADQRGDYVLGQELLRKGTMLNPMNYDLPYLGIYNAIWLVDDVARARWFATMIRRIPDAPNFMRRLEEYIERTAGRFDMAFEFNVRYFLDYFIAGNDVERELTQNRIRTLLDKWYVDELTQSAQRYIEDHGEHPEAMEDLLVEEYMPAFEAPIYHRFAEAVLERSPRIDQMPARREIPQEFIDEVVEASREFILGLPPDPYGTWYMIHEPTREALLEEPSLFADADSLPYITSAQGLTSIIDRQSLAAQTFIMDFHATNQRRPTQEEVADFLTRDPLGGHYVYQPEAEESPVYGVFYSTAGRRVSEGRDPRMGAWGTGPFPLPLMPRLSDFPVDREWGIENGYILEDGTELWYLEEEALSDAGLIPVEEEEEEAAVPAPPD